MGVVDIDLWHCHLRCPPVQSELDRPTQLMYAEQLLYHSRVGALLTYNVITGNAIHAARAYCMCMLHVACCTCMLYAACVCRILHVHLADADMYVHTASSSW